MLRSGFAIASGIVLAVIVDIAGIIWAEMIQSPWASITAIVLGFFGLVTSGIGLARYWIRIHYNLARNKQHIAQLQATNNAYRLMCTKERKCPFTEDGSPACVNIAEPKEEAFDGD